MRLMDWLNEIGPISSERDIRWWTKDRRRGFTVKIFYLILVNWNYYLFSGKVIWQPTVPFKVSIFTLNAFFDKILTLDCLWSRGWNLSNTC